MNMRGRGEGAKNAICTISYNPKLLVRWEDSGVVSTKWSCHNGAQWAMCTMEGLQIIMVNCAAFPLGVVVRLGGLKK